MGKPTLLKMTVWSQWSNKGSKMSLSKSSSLSHTKLVRVAWKYLERWCLTTLLGSSYRCIEWIEALLATMLWLEWLGWCATLRYRSGCSTALAIMICFLRWCMTTFQSIWRLAKTWDWHVNCSHCFSNLYSFSVILQLMPNMNWLRKRKLSRRKKRPISKITQQSKS